MNQKFSRLYAIFSITMIQYKFILNTKCDSRLSNKRSDDGSGEWTSVTSKFYFVKLASIKKTGTVEDHVKEEIFINSVLLVLGNVLSALGQETPSFQY
ncbi:hypothetical protein C2G38_2205949 [Gigaspora rosea]|uniref:Kinesin motor domain-containing protein n=1 Tax=Gigaspora rosea TaxID=44941 RepID=A0A397UTH4_9GLOM|nr:hypothetical protein C2G38_2205949 [Gigaspora rosea]